MYHMDKVHGFTIKDLSMDSNSGVSRISCKCVRRLLINSLSRYTICSRCLLDKKYLLSRWKNCCRGAAVEY